MLDQIRDIYRRSIKPVDNPFNRYLARPLAAVLVWWLLPTRWLPNQLTFFSLGVACLSAAVLGFWPGYLGGLLGALFLEASFVIDCADGQLARLRRQQTDVGHHLDFLMDELKAYLILGAVSFRLYRETGSLLYLLLGMVGLICLASGISLTTFMRRPEFRRTAPGASTVPGEPWVPDSASIPAPPSASSAPSPVARAIHLAEEVGHWLIHYPSYLWLLALLGRLEIYFFVYSAVSAAYLGRSLLQIGIRLGGASAYAAAAPSQAASPAAPAKASPAMPAAIDHQHEVSPP